MTEDGEQPRSPEEAQRTVRRVSALLLWYALSVAVLMSLASLGTAPRMLLAYCFGSALAIGLARFALVNGHPSAVAFTRAVLIMSLPTGAACGYAGWVMLAHVHMLDGLFGLLYGGIGVLNAAIGVFNVVSVMWLLLSNQLDSDLWSGLESDIDDPLERDLRREQLEALAEHDRSQHERR